jgi:hypothetical protein
VKKDEMDRPLIKNGDKRNACGLMVGMPKGTRQLGRPRRRWLDAIKMGVEVIGWDDME